MKIKGNYLNKNNSKLTYISLFSSAGIGCYGFKTNGFECIATNEIIKRRLEIQKINNKCSMDSAYILGDIQDESIKSAIKKQIDYYKKKDIGVDVLIATPPCQGMSVANHKKKFNDIYRNSLVVESIKLIKEIRPKFFIIENVPSFCKTKCIDEDEQLVEIGAMIYKKLGSFYSIYDNVINFKNYGANSSRKRTLMIGVCNELSNLISPLELFPDFCKEKTLYEIIGNLPSLEWGSVDPKDCLHSFRIYPERMREWICDLKEGENAFDNKDEYKKPHRIIDGKIIVNKSKNGDKYARQIYEKVAPCIHTRNDQLASQNTIHPKEDRVFSIRELMLLMNIPKDFKWFKESLNEVNQMSIIDKKFFLKKNEINIRQCIGEAVPTIIFDQIAFKISNFLNQYSLNKKLVQEEIKNNKLREKNNLIQYIKQHLTDTSISSLSMIAEMANKKRDLNSAYFTNKFIINEIMKELPDFNNRDSITIIEPSVGSGNFLPLLFKKYAHIKKVKLTVIEIDKNMLDIAKLLYQEKIPSNFEVEFICEDFLTLKCSADLIVGNPPFGKIYKKILNKNFYSPNLTNLAGVFLEKALTSAEYISFVMPKNILNTSDYQQTRVLLQQKGVVSILDIGEQGFSGVLIETANFVIGKKEKTIRVQSLHQKIKLNQKPNYIFDHRLPYWVIYRNDFFDSIFHKMQFNVFNVFRDRQLTNSNTKLKKVKNSIRILKSRNISDDGLQIIPIENYDSYIELSELKKYKIFEFLERDDVYLTPNMTYKPRVIKKEKGHVVNGSIAILIPKKNNFSLTSRQMSFFATEEFRNFYKIARNYQTRTLNIDQVSCFWFGLYSE
ncbi:DNA (cytosine-5-)-methyltransferase [Campylobacter lari]|nr:DNA (cytosine-5-)-methyltransferase [Campylobacter lari]EEU8400118.1 DNA (cytosine-5-)-methyltransferase [Campylobacter lari]